MAKRTKFTQEQINEILKMYEDGSKIAEIADCYGTTHSHISYIANSNGMRRQTAHKFTKTGGGEALPQVSQRDWRKGSKVLSFLCDRYSLKQRNRNREAVRCSQNGYAFARKLQNRV